MENTSVVIAFKEYLG
jgi:hypothetical protein